MVVSDESRFHLCPDDHRRQVWRRSGYRDYPAFPIARHTGSQQGVMVSTSSSNRVAKSETEEDESSEYVTATDHSPHSPQRMPGRKKGPSEEDDVPTSFESFSSPSKSSIHHKSSESPPSLLKDGADLQAEERLDNCLYYDKKLLMQKYVFAFRVTLNLLVTKSGNGDLDLFAKSGNGSPRRTADADDVSIYLSAALPPDDLESSDESTKKETPPTTPSTESEEGVTPFHKVPHDTSGTPDSDRTSDITALFDPSPEPLSSLQEPQTVIEIRSEATSEEILSVGNDDDEMDRIDDEDSFPRGNGSRSERGGSESSESSSVLSGLQDMENVVKYGGGMERLQMGSFMPLDIRKTADELSTVSEVSEESSKNGMIRVRKDGTTDRRGQSHPPQCTTSREDRQIVGMAVTDRSVTSRTVAQHIESVTHHSRVTLSAVYSSGLSARCPLLGLPLTQNHRRLSHQWCDERRMWVAEWNEVVFT
ncbi:transposable element Tcb1 transposase [Trichonephila clavipes]|nr:transposable element Tcb1 transposase [Trichonephila clavipes]